MLRSILLPLAALVLLNASAQTHDHSQRRCGSQLYSQHYMQENGLPTDLLGELPRIGMQERGGVYTVPVVVHVVWNTAAENITTGTIQAIIAELNADYNRANTDLGSVRPGFTNSIGDVSFNFCLAQVDPSGLATTGITRTQTTRTWFNPDTQTNDMKSAPFGKAPWDTNRYLNIWICDITSGAVGGTITVGYAYLPTGGMVGSAIDGLVIDYDYGTDVGARTATHEIGHYFGLLHPFDEDGNCVNADGFSDTPTTDQPTFSCNNTNLMRCGTLTQYENFMDYSNCTVMFTNQQANYMTGILTGIRSGLLANNACNVTPTGYCIPTSANGTADGDFVNGVVLGSINNTNSGAVGAPTYTNFSAAHSTNLVRNTSNTISITGGTYSPDSYAAWIDYDNDQLFEASEKLGEFATTATGQTQTITFLVPASAPLGATRLRVRGVYLNTGEPNPVDPCFNYAFGETEDYGITITGPVVGPCVPTSANGTSDGDFINAVVLEGIRNLNSGSNTAPAYTNFSSAHSTTLYRNSPYGVLIQSGEYTTDSYAVWIDYDQDNTFEPTEKLGEFATTAAAEVQTIFFTVPAGAPLGNTRMRVRGVFLNTGEPNPVDPCFSYAYGETEDYGITIGNAPSGYCLPTSLSGPTDGDYINGVSLGSINNQNSGGAAGPAYTNYSATQSTNLGRGTSQTLTIQGGTYAPDNYAAWIDYNNDLVFGANEKLGEFASTVPNANASISFTVPISASLGSTRMRVRGVYFNGGEPTPVHPCFSYAFGETEDYGIVIETTTGIDQARNAGFGLFPNPAANSVTVIAHSSTNADVALIDLQGRIIQTFRANGQRFTIDLKTVADGTYLVRVVQDGSSTTQRLEVIGNDR